MIECYIRLRVNSIQNYYHQINLFMILYHISLRYNIKSFRRMIYISQSVINVDYIYYISVMIEFESVAYNIHCAIFYGDFMNITTHNSLFYRIRNVTVGLYHVQPPQRRTVIFMCIHFILL